MHAYTSCEHFKVVHDLKRRRAQVTYDVEHAIIANKATQCGCADVRMCGCVPPSTRETDMRAQDPLLVAVHRLLDHFS